MSDTVSAEGTVAAAQTDNLNFRSSGTVTAVNVQAGDAVTAGQVLATIDSAELQSAVSSAQSSVANAQAKLSDDEASGASSAQITADETNLTSANDSLASAQQALDGASLVATFNGVVSQVNITVGEQLSSGGAGATSATGSGSGSGRTSASIGNGGNSAFGGGGAANNGSSSSSSSTTQIQVVSKGSYTTSLPVSSNDIANVAAGQQVTLTVTTSSANGFGGGFGGRFGAFAQALGLGGARGEAGAGNGGAGASGATRGTGAGNTSGATATGTVTDVAKVATASSGVATYPVTVAFTADANSVYVGATVSGAIATNVRPNVLQVPVLAVTRTTNGATVTVATRGTLSGPKQTRAVGTGATSNGMVEITSGLKEGDTVIERVPTFTNTGTGSTPGGNVFRNGGFGGAFPGNGRGAGGAGATGGESTNR